MKWVPRSITRSYGGRKKNANYTIKGKALAAQPEFSRVCIVFYAKKKRRSPLRFWFHCNFCFSNRLLLKCFCIECLES